MCKLAIIIACFGFFSLNCFGKSRDCSKRLESAINEMDEWKNYGIKRTGQGVVQFPTKCTPFMKKNGFFPLTKRKAAGVTRERYLGKDCNVYEWDSQHGAFEQYRPGSGNRTFYHDGEVSAVTGSYSAKISSKRDHDFSETGIPGITMKDLCKKHKKGELGKKDLKNSQAKNLLNCL